MGKIHEYPVASQVSGNDLILLDTADGSSYVNKSASVKNIVGGVIKHYSYSGKMIGSSTTDVDGYGHADIDMFNGVAMIQVVCRISQVATSGGSSDFGWGINSNLFTSVTGKEITPVTGGVLNFFTNSGALYMDKIQYGGVGQRNGPYWAPARVYTTSGNIGTWASSQFGVNYMFSGTLFGTYTV